MKRRTARRLAIAALLTLTVGGFSWLGTRTDIAEIGNGGPQLTVAVNQEPDTLDPTSTRDSATSRPVLANVFESLVGTGNDGELIPLLARSWTVLDEGRVIEFSLRPGVTFHSGDPLTAADVVFSHERMMQRSPQYANWMRLVERAEAVDDATVRFHFTRPDASFLSRVGPVASHAYHRRVGEELFSAQPVGTGPYRFSGRRMGQYVDVEAFADYHDGPLGQPSVPRVRFVFVADNPTRVAMLRAGEADVIGNVPFSAVERVRQAGFNTVSVPAMPTVLVQFSNRNPDVPWADRRVRQAIAHAIDADAIIANVLFGVPQRNAALAPGELGYDPQLEPHAYDPQLARRLLADAGYPNGFTMPLYYWIGSFQGVRETAEAVTLNLRAVGIRADVRGLDGARILELLRRTAGDSTVAYAGVMPTPLSNTPEPIYALANVFFSQSSMAPYANAELDEAIAAASGALDNRERAGHIRRAYRLLHEDVGAIPLWSAVTTTAMQPHVRMEPLHRSQEMRLVNLRVDAPH